MSARIWARCFRSSPKQSWPVPLWLSVVPKTKGNAGRAPCGVGSVVYQCLQHIPKEEYRAAIRKWEDRCKMWMKAYGAYFEGLRLIKFWYFKRFWKDRPTLRTYSVNCTLAGGPNDSLNWFCHPLLAKIWQNTYTNWWPYLQNFPFNSMQKMSHFKRQLGQLMASFNIRK